MTWRMAGPVGRAIPSCIEYEFSVTNFCRVAPLSRRLAGRLSVAWSVASAYFILQLLYLLRVRTDVVTC